MQVTNKGVLNFTQISKTVKAENSSIQILGNNNEVFIESRCSFKNIRIVIRGDNNKLHIKRSSWFLGGTISIANQGFLTIGERSSFGAKLEFLIESSNVNIGDDCMVSAGITLRTTDIHGIYDLSSREIINKPQDVSIGDYVWVNKEVTILKGASIGHCNVIESQSVFTEKSEPFELWSGTPAKKIKNDVMWSKSAHLQEITDDKYAEMYLKKYKGN